MDKEIPNINIFEHRKFILLTNLACLIFGTSKINYIIERT